MIWWVMLIFFVASPLYAWGMLHLFGTDFRWSLAAPLGILCVVSISYLFGLVPFESVLYLAAAFYAAYPGMLYHDLKYRQMLKDKQLNMILVLQAVLDASDNPEIEEIHINTSEVKNWQAVYEAQQLIDQYKDVTGWKSERFFTH